MASYSSVDDVEIEKFSRIASEWWDPNGKFRPLHKMNPVRLEFITSRIADHFGLDRNAQRYLDGLEILDIGCGGGLLTEPLSRLGAKVTGVDASEKNIEVARAHARESGLTINYKTSTIEELFREGGTFDAVLNMEVIEHVENPESFLRDSCNILKPGGAMVLSTLNRTLKSYAMAIVGAEYVLRWLPKGTHEWKRFLKPSEISHWFREAGMNVSRISGMSYNPLRDEWSLTDSPEVNYLMFATKSK